MYKVIIADDEHYVVNWLTDILATNIPDLELQQAFSGYDVLQAASNRIIDIAILDIYMPGINGIETAKKLLKNHPRCRIILLTGYDEFDLIYQINNITNIRYLLKTEGDKEIIRNVENTIAELEKEQMQQSLIDHASKQQLLLAHFEQRGILLDILYESEDTAYMEKKLSSYFHNLHLNATQPVGITLIHLLGSAPNRASLDSEKLLCLYHCLDFELGEYFTFSILDISNTYIYLLTQPKEASCKSNSAFLKSELDQVLQSFQKQSKYQVRFFTWLCELPWSEIPQTIDVLLQYDHFLSMDSSLSVFGMLITDQELAQLGKNQTQNSAAVQILFQQQIQKLSDALFQLDHPLFDESINKIRQLLPTIVIYPQSKQAELRGQLSLCILNYLNYQQYRSTAWQNISLKPLYRSMGEQDWNALLQYISHLTSAIFESSIEDDASSKINLIHSITKYISENLSGDLSVANLADTFNYNQTYISRLFKQITGNTLSQYVKTVRLNYAKELLLTTDMSVQTIAKTVGFDTAQYFTMVFRKEVGVTPNAFRHSGS